MYDLKIIFDPTAFLLGAKHETETDKAKPETSLVMYLGETINGNPPRLCGRQVAGSNTLAIAVAQSD